MFVAHLIFDIAKLTGFLLRIIPAVNCGYGTNGWRSSAFTKEFMAMICMIWGGCMSEHLFAFLHDARHTRIPSRTPWCLLGKHSVLDGLLFPFLRDTNSRRTSWALTRNCSFLDGLSFPFSRHWLTLHITVLDVGVKNSILRSFG